MNLLWFPEIPAQGELRINNLYVMPVMVQDVVRYAGGLGYIATTDIAALAAPVTEQASVGIATVPESNNGCPLAAGILKVNGMENSSFQSKKPNGFCGSCR
jgi:hypothetical protein